MVESEASAAESEHRQVAEDDAGPAWALGRSVGRALRWASEVTGLTLTSTGPNMDTLLTDLAELCGKRAESPEALKDAPEFWQLVEQLHRQHRRERFGLKGRSAPEKESGAEAGGESEQASGGVEAQAELPEAGGEGAGEGEPGKVKAASAAKASTGKKKASATAAADEADEAGEAPAKPESDEGSES